jgi:trehalose 6-phosphate phosphatase
VVSVEENTALPDIDLQRSALLLDIDGTLLDIAARPDAVRVPRGLATAIARLSAATSGAVAFVTGRTVGDVDRLFRPLCLVTVGCHGAEFRPSPAADIQVAAPLPDIVRIWAKEIALAAPGVVIEDKGRALALHYRLAPEHGPFVLRALLERQAEFAAKGLQLLRGKMLIEIKQRGFNKGVGLEKLMQLAPFKGRTPVFFGDDTTDEDVFRILPEFGGRGFAVGRPMPGAEHVFESPGAVRRFLAQLTAERPEA